MKQLTRTTPTGSTGRTRGISHECVLLATMTLSLMLLAACDTADDSTEAPDSIAAAASSSNPQRFKLPYRPNVLWLVAEDLGPIIAPFGDSTIVTPNLSRLAEEGIRYTRVFSPSGVCAPSRAAIATGLYPTSFGAQHMRTGPWWGGRPPAASIERANEQMVDGLSVYEAVPPPDARMLSEYLRREGYYVTNNQKQDYQFVAPAMAWDESGGTAHWTNRAAGQPFFAVFNFNVTHESRVWAKANDSLFVPGDLDVPVPPYLPDNDIVRTDIRRVYSNVVEMDIQVGKRLEELEASGLLDSTIVVWYTDHGGPLPRQKRELYDSGLHVPMIIRYPDAGGLGPDAGSIDDQLISFVDLLPTTLSLAGFQPPGHVHGRAFAGPYAAGAAREYVYAAADRFDEERDTRRAVRDARYKYIRNLHPERSAYLPLEYRENMATMQEMLRLQSLGELSAVQSAWFAPSKPTEELYDTQTDPFEINNLAADSTLKEKLQVLRTALDLWEREFPDQGMIDEAEYVASIWPSGAQPETEPPSGSFSGNILTLESATEGAGIGYQILSGSGGDLPDSNWLIYTQPIQLNDTQRAVAFAHRIGYLPSDTVGFAATF